MKTFSESVRGLEPAAQRRLYTLFQRAVKGGEFSALKLLNRFEVQGVKGPRQVQDYAYTDETAAQVAEWMGQHEKTRGPQGFKAEDLQGMSDAELTNLIHQQSKPIRKRTRKPKKNNERTPANEC